MINNISRARIPHAHGVKSRESSRESRDPRSVHGGTQAFGSPSLPRHGTNRGWSDTPACTRPVYSVLYCTCVSTLDPRLSCSSSPCECVLALQHKHDISLQWSGDPVLSCPPDMNREATGGEGNKKEKACGEGGKTRCPKGPCSRSFVRPACIHLRRLYIRRPEYNRLSRVGRSLVMRRRVPYPCFPWADHSIVDRSTTASAISKMHAVV